MNFDDKRIVTVGEQFGIPGGFSWTIDYKLAGMKFPVSEQDYRALIPLNIGLIICLNETLPSFHKTVFNAVDCGPKILHVAVNDYCVPTNFEKIDLMVAQAASVLQSGKAVVCHCMAGLSRT